MPEAVLCRLLCARENPSACGGTSHLPWPAAHAKSPVIFILTVTTYSSLIIIFPVLVCFCFCIDVLLLF
jgi:hypothetical protein